MRAIGLVTGALATWLLGAVGLDLVGHARDVSDGSWDVIVVAGAPAASDGTPGRALEARCRRALALFERGRAPRILVSGGAEAGPHAEADVGAAWLAARGVPYGAILRESRSTSTEENAAFSAEMLGAARVLVVTDAYHAFRTERVWRRYVSEVAVAVVDSPWPSRWRGAVREVRALIYYAWLGRLS